MPPVTRRRPFRLDTIHPSVLVDTHSAWFGRKWVGTCRERVLLNRAKWGGSNNYILQLTSVVMPLVTRWRPFRLNTIHPSVLGDTYSAWFGWKWVGTRRERVLFIRVKWGGL